MTNIGVIGLRGYGVIYSGYETFIQFLVSRSNKKNLYFHLFCRLKYKNQSTYKKEGNFNLIYVPLTTGKYFGTLIYNFAASLISLSKKIDIILYLGTANVPFIIIQKIFGRKTIVNTAGIDWNKKRWSIFGKWYLIFCERMTVAFADVILCDSKTVLEYYRKTYSNRNLVYIPYGAEVTRRKAGSILKRFNLIKRKYIYTVGRLSPENCFEDILIAFRKVKTEFKCVVVGDSIYESEYKKYLQDLAKGDNRIVFTGFLKGKAYEEICSNAYAYVETKSIGGTHPSLLEAMAFRMPIIAKNIDENMEVVHDSALVYKKNDIKSLIEHLSFILNNRKEMMEKGLRAKKIVQKYYNWNSVVTKYEDLFNKIA
jgi:glycosyltransferase involved in cell wall biosynthesis